ncbi:MAG: ATP-binding cassette domain-containing protein [Lachnospiraceae bacterium]|jgi:putative ABC transport system permease protein
MLQLKNITKDYITGGETVHALRGISLDFRKNEFVSVLGPSGCGKTTMLNIIGGLDHYTDGNLIISGRSTKGYKDRDWDSYRNYSVGFIFQSYNLIPHQSVLRNVELALVLSGVSRSERRRRAKKVLENVGLGDQLRKRPAEMSGGQIQRVAIARALVNDPDIILADEPTGSLDSETSTQVMDILKEVSKDRLVVMVTHNKELAEKYSTRIVRILDGLIISDSRPMTEDELNAAAVADEEALRASEKVKRPSMSLATSFSLSLNNLLTKKGRTILTALAGSIGIIGIALILSVSQGTTRYINTIQKETLTSYPLTIEKTTVDLTSLMETFMNINSPERTHEIDAVYKKPAIFDMINSFNNLETRENDLRAFKAYLEDEMTKNEEDAPLSSAVSGIKYTYDLPLLVYTENIDGKIIRCDTAEMMTELMAKYMGMDYGSMLSGSGDNFLISAGTSRMSSNISMWEEILEGKDGSPVSNLVKEQYDMIYGSWPNDYDEVVLVLDENNELTDLTLYTMGLINDNEVELLKEEAKSDSSDTEMSWSYEDICAREYRVVLNSSCFIHEESTGLFADLRDTDTGLKYLYDNGLTLKVVGIIRPNEDAVTNMLTGSIAHTAALTKYVIDESQKSDAIKAQQKDPSVDVISGLPFKETTGVLTDEEKEIEFRKYISGLKETDKASKYVEIMSIPEDDFVADSVRDALAGMTREDMTTSLSGALIQEMGMSESNVYAYVESMSDEDLTELFEGIIAEQVKARYADGVHAQMAEIPPAQLSMLLDGAMPEYKTRDCARYYDHVMNFSGSDYDSTLLKLGYVDLKSPATINIFASTFENKDVIEKEIARYNEDLEELEQIKYTDYVGLIMSSVTIIINAITYVLIAFVAISLIVSSIMIGVITLISVQERTKEIGILRSIGASKKNVASMFNVETMIIGLASGLLGVGVTYLLCIPINLILQHVTGIAILEAYLPGFAAVILVVISVLLTLISGIIPSRSAAKKDPVVALRTE